MFLTLRHEQNALLATQPDATVTDLACTTCRTKKLKCTRERGGCHYCRLRNVRCLYPDAARKKTLRRKRGKLSNFRPEDLIGRPLGPKSPPGGVLLTNQQNGTQRDLGVVDAFSTMGVCNSPAYATLGGLPSGLHVDGMDFSPLDDYFQSDTNFLWDSAELNTVLDSGCPVAVQSSSTLTSDLFDSHLSQTPPLLSSTTSLSARSSLDTSSLPYISKAPPSDRISNHSLQPSCQCTSTALSLITTVLASTTHSTLPSVPSDLRLNKHILNQSLPLLRCTACQHDANSLTLLILLAEKILLSYENLVQKLIDRYNYLHSDHPYPQHRPGSISTMDDPAEDPGRIMHEPDNSKRRLLRDYEVDVEDEPCVFGGLVQMQLRTLRSFLGKLRARASEENGDTVAELVDAIEKNLVKQLRICGSCADGD